MNPTETKNMTRDEAMRRIDRAAQENWKKLNLSGLDFEEVPSEIGKCTQLETLVFAAYQQKKEARKSWITKFPDAVLQLTNLKILKLSGHEITEIPETIGQLSNLTKLHLGNNKITKIPETLGQLSNLTWLDLNHNQITSLPGTVRDIEKLEILDLQGNPTPIPPELLPNKGFYKEGDVLVLFNQGTQRIIKRFL